MEKDLYGMHLQRVCTEKSYHNPPVDRVIHSMEGILLKICTLNIGTLFIIERMFNVPGLTRLLFEYGFTLEYSSYWGISTYTTNFRITLSVVIMLTAALFLTYLITFLLLRLMKQVAAHA